jgi:hypothetical protein
MLGRRLTGVDEGEARAARSSVGDRFNTCVKSDTATGGSRWEDSADRWARRQPQRH